MQLTFKRVPLSCLTCNTSVRDVFPWIRFVRNFTTKNKKIDKHSRVSEKVGHSFPLLLCTEHLFMSQNLFCMEPKKVKKELSLRVGVGGSMPAPRGNLLSKSRSLSGGRRLQ